MKLIAHRKQLATSPLEIQDFQYKHNQLWAAQSFVIQNASSMVFILFPLLVSCDAEEIDKKFSTHPFLMHQRNKK